jgi:hypothetical protein
MSRLYFTPVDKAFTLGSSQIKDTQEEINQLTKLILNNKQKSGIPKKDNYQQENSGYQEQQTIPYEKNNYQRIGYPDQQTAVFRPPNNGNQSPQDNIDYNLMKIVGHPRFDEIVKNYVLINHPEWLLKETIYTPVNFDSKSNFGNRYQSTIKSDVQKYITFFIICVFLFVLLSAAL